MRILYISVAYPLPPNNGVRMRLCSLLRAMQAAGHEVTFASFAEPEEIGGRQLELRTLCQESDIVPLRYTSLSGGGDCWCRLNALFSSLPFTVERFRSNAMRMRLERRLREHCFDVIICDSVFAAVNLPAEAAPVVMGSHNVEYLILERYADQQTNPLMAWYARTEASKLRRFEAAMYRRAVLGMACSRADAELLGRLCPGIRTVIAPNVVDVAEYGTAGVEEPSTIVYQGGMDWFPNRDALEYFVREILPLIQKEAPNVRLIAAGRNPSPEFCARFSDVPALQFTGTLPDLRPVIARAAVCVVPLRIGSGTRLKILEAGAMGKAMVSTTIGAEGLAFVPGEEILIADGPARFAGSVLDLLADPKRRQALGKAARERVVQDYDVAALGRAMAEVLEIVKASIITEPGSIELAPVGQGEAAC
jgi:glycosyltransferase involved in cell wall biosynthesis